MSADRGVSIEYLDAFYNGLEQDELTELFATFKGWEADGDPNAADWADAVGNGLLTLSNPDYGGNWERVPQDIRDTIHYGYEPGSREPGSGVRLDRLDALGAVLGEANPEYRPGTEMGIELNRVAGYMAGVPTYADPHLVPTPDPSYYDETARTFLDIGTRNPDVSHHLLTGTDVDGAPSDFDRDEVLVPLLTREWEDEGATLAGLTDWIAADAIPSDPSDPADIARAQRAGQAAFGLAEVLSSPESAWDGGNNFDRFLHMPEPDGHLSDRTLGEVNPLAVQSFSKRSHRTLPTWSGQTKTPHPLTVSATSALSRRPACSLSSTPILRLGRSSTAQRSRRPPTSIVGSRWINWEVRGNTPTERIRAGCRVSSRSV